jgi:hypothetical protein
MSRGQQIYSAYYREPLAMYEDVKHFRRMLKARHFVILTNQKPLTYAFSQKRDKCCPRQFNHLDFISQFTTDIRHISGQENVFSDALSRVEAVCTSVSPEALTEGQATDAELANILHGTTALRLEKIHFPGTDVTLQCDTSTNRPRQYVPEPPPTASVRLFPRSGRPRNKGDSQTHFPAIRVTWSAEGLPHLGTSVPVLPAVEDIQPHHHATGRLHCLLPGSSTCTSTSLALFHRTASDTASRQ